MAFTQLVAQANRSGTFTSPAIVIPAGTTGYTIRLTSSNWTTTGNSMAWAVDRSDDGGANWREITDGVTPEGALAKDGSLPSIGFTYTPPATAHQLRARCRITGTLRFGLEQEII